MIVLKCMICWDLVPRIYDVPVIRHNKCQCKFHLWLTIILCLYHGQSTQFFNTPRLVLGSQFNNWCCFFSAHLPIRNVARTILTNIFTVNLLPFVQLFYLSLPPCHVGRVLQLRTCNILHNICSIVMFLLRTCTVRNRTLGNFQTGS